jgi:hypothetical protein
MRTGSAGCGTPPSKRSMAHGAKKKPMSSFLLAADLKVTACV